MKYFYGILKKNNFVWFLYVKAQKYGKTIPNIYPTMTLQFIQVKGFQQNNSTSVVLTYYQLNCILSTVSNIIWLSNLTSVCVCVYVCVEAHQTRPDQTDMIQFVFPSELMQHNKITNKTLPEHPYHHRRYHQLFISLPLQLKSVNPPFTVCIHSKEFLDQPAEYACET